MANKKLGYIPVYRSVQEHWIWNSEEPFDCRSAWIDLLLSVNHEERKIQVGRSVIVIHRGQMWTSYVKLAKRWKWSRNRVYRYIEMLKSDKMVMLDATPNGTLLTIVNYGFFALRENTNRTTGDTTGETTSDTSNDTTGDTTGDTQTINNNNYKNIKNVENLKKEPASPSGGGEWQ